MTIQKFLAMKGKEKIVMVTAYDTPTAKIAEEAGVDIILIGDSIGNNVLGYDSTIPVTMEEIIIHLKAVRRGAPNSFIVADMPFLSYGHSIEEAVKNAGILIKNGANAVKIEGGKFHCNLIEKCINIGIPVMGHLGFTPQSINIFGGYKVQGKKEDSKKTILESAIALEQCGVFSIVLEMVTEELAKEITEKISIPTIGIGAGRYCDGQVLVFHDIVGLNPNFKPKFSKQYANTYSIMLNALKEFKKDVKEKNFPKERHTFKGGK
ncbi:3-methyl-2-oxobutanoate hydroxymethyltransferase [Thermosipho melanesiensis]|uniref:3-methyl-2-oxobutanoate hydroxymethyltransferase n=2 Tax=Thermosipho melanesiensis TaxID=46541 RepID=PANB_THEM4|nr:3-methyl-2-oxobutanoate hydroxymethyltransferase [Thermosipho melanesiensis]A6LMK5.1 RecName: Full=3-methyl-2-oxobutanoate hydroxymethyltransferase; AltName: Full=Ketopantoate hydroxymethyltransferase; Short=KPHMT [Thermosipho melanesiensis BI429]ABR31156.1 3-methyl-2-oxobutanoate hydroxymethyltransferase [Thermosipho melanesiensis BI429]APT74246.1 3-methyl-2-oxobutanoate hydroxymethyltransferase [Thermosipho melanesiensis]OOC36794.1 3-methyl-2-oxobutanoate hydroxymethyltransferase [Thermosi